MRVVIVDEHALFRIGVRQGLAASADLQVVGEASNAEALFEAIETQLPDVVLMDLALPDMDGLTAIGVIRRLSPRTRVLILSAYEQVHDVLDALRAGAAGYALKSDDPEALIRAVRQVGRGDRYLTPAIAKRMAVYEVRRRPTHAVLDVLSEREREVFRLAASCLLTREIAEELKISRKTVDTHLFRIHRKLGLHNSAELVRLAMALQMGGERYFPNGHVDIPAHAVTPSEGPRAPAHRATTARR
jgi:DNA-binding NarL/FixJ family response regulator